MLALAPESAAAFDRLARRVAEVTGFRDGTGLRLKLRTIFGGDDEETAQGWLHRLARQAPGTGEWQVVLERLMVPETFFFRDAPQLDILRNRILPALIKRKRAAPSRAIRIWSAGCSSGEEPYTLAMLVLDALLVAGEAVELPGGVQLNPGWSVQVQGTDINARVVETARRGTYTDFGLSPFRETPPQYRRFFVPEERDERGRRFSVRADVRAITWFGTHNITLGAAGWDFDIVSCRNVLIYFDEASKAAATSHLACAVAEGGTLMLGPTDPFDGVRGFELVDARTSPVLNRMAGGKA